MPSNTDLVVIGAGPGGYTAAFYAADKGLKVTMVEASSYGGTCLNVGCIPSKAYLHVAKLIEEAKAASVAGVYFNDPKIDIDKLRSFKDSVVKKLSTGIEGLAKSRKVQLVKGYASFISDHEVEVQTAEGKESIIFKHAIIATGSVPIIPKALQIDSDRVIDSTGALELKDIPERFLVVGGGVIGLEMGCVYAGLGSNVTVIEALPQLANGVDRDLAQPLIKKIKHDFENILTDTRVLALKQVDQKVEVEYEVNEERKKESFDRVLLSIGRRPNSDRLNLKSAGVEVDERGFIPANKSLQTNIAHIYAIGDVIGNPMLAHKASREGKIAVEKILGYKSEFDNLGIPSVIYTDPEIAWVGLTETEAKEKNIDYKLGKFPWGASGRALSMSRTDGMTKILFDPETERVLGVGIAGPHAGELLAEGGLALEMGAVMEDLAGTIHAHPTLSETLMESAEALHGVATHIHSKVKK